MTCLTADGASVLGVEDARAAWTAFANGGGWGTVIIQGQPNMSCLEHGKIFRSIVTHNFLSE